MAPVRIKRIYDPVEDSDGFRVLVDRVWPRGLSRQKAAIDLWAKDVAPSTDLRRWFNHDPARWEEFQRRYRAELNRRSAELRALLDQCGARPLTLLFAARDTHRNQAVVLRDVLVDLKGQL